MGRPIGEIDNTVYNKFCTKYELYSAVINDDLKTVKHLWKNFPELKEVQDLLCMKTKIGMMGYFSSSISIAIECAIQYDRIEILKYLCSIIEIDRSLYLLFKKIIKNHNREHMLEWFDEKYKEFKSIMVIDLSPSLGRLILEPM